MKKLVAIIDYGMGNLFSVSQACEAAGVSALVTSKGKEILKADYAILPGVGAFGQAMENLSALNLIDPIGRFIKSGRPFMGVCLGMQLLFTESDEFGKYRGLNAIAGSVIRFSGVDKGGNRAKVPQVGWNRIYGYGRVWRNSPLSGVLEDSFMYFVHSYYCAPLDSGLVLSLSEYEGTEFCSGIIQENVCAFQFHPEKSGRIGIGIYKNWLKAA